MYELKDYLNLFRRHTRLILGGAVAAALVTTAISYFLPPCFEASAVLYVARKVEEPQESYFTYEGFYGQQTAERYTETVVGLLTSEDIARQALRRVGRPDDSNTVKSVLRELKARRAAPQLVSLRVKQASEQEARDLWKALSDSVIETAGSLNQVGDERLSISLLEKEPLVKDTNPALWLGGSLGFIAGLFVFTVLSSLIEYFQVSFLK